MSSSQGIVCQYPVRYSGLSAAVLMCCYAAMWQIVMELYGYVAEVEMWLRI